ncbi:hypothetical protein EYF80_014204 [Liparis tanakae]|uniref:Uncharacterized protein n=1 Tax=Liparis tanakae TaxID=230148 RepID=A0A4Z2IC22_9TELE|nr:hypothetical protein EYF80_014204 [Liparis tanakae]
MVLRTESNSYKQLLISSNIHKSAYGGYSPECRTERQRCCGNVALRFPLGGNSVARYLDPKNVVTGSQRELPD